MCTISNCYFQFFFSSYLISIKLFFNKQRTIIVIHINIFYFRVSGDLRIFQKSLYHRRYAEVKDGSLILFKYTNTRKEFDFRIPLYNLNINLDSPRSCTQFSLSKYGKITPLTTFQVR